MRWVGLIVCCLMSTRVFSQGYSDAAQTALAGSNVVSLANGIQHLNPAAITQIEKRKIGFSQALPYSLPEISYNSLFYQYNRKNNFIAIDYTHLSFDALSDNTFALVYAKRLNEKLSLGIKVKYNFIRVELNNYHKFLPEIGLVYRVNKYTDIGTYWSQSQSIFEFRQWQSSIKTGLLFKKIKKLPIYLSTDINSNADLFLKCGFEYRITEKLYSRLAISTEDSYLSFGIFYKIKRIEIECANSMHKYLGISPCMTISYELN